MFTKKILMCSISKAVFIFFSMQRLGSSIPNLEMFLLEFTRSTLNSYLFDIFNTIGIGLFHRLQNLQRATQMLVNEMGCTSLKAS